MATKKKTTTKKFPKPARFTIEFEPNYITSPEIEMEAFMWDESRPEVCITLYEDSVTNVYIQSPADLEKMANWLLKAAEWMRNKKKG